MGLFGKKDLATAIDAFDRGDLMGGAGILAKEMGAAKKIHEDLAALADLINQYNEVLVSVDQAKSRSNVPPTRRWGPHGGPRVRVALVGNLEAQRSKAQRLRTQIRALTRKLYIDERDID